MLGLINILTTASDAALATAADSPEASEAASAAQKYMEIVNDLKSDWQIKSEQNQKESKQLEKIKELFVF